MRVDNAAIRSFDARSTSRRRLLRGVLALATGSLVPEGASADANERFRTLRPGVLRIGTYFVNPPFEFVEGRRRLGFELDLMDALARRLHLAPDFVNTRWETILQEMRDKRYDCIVGGITITPERERTLAWSVPYLTTTLSLVVDETRSPQVKTLADLSGKTLGVQAATTDYDAAIAMQRAGSIGAVKVYPFARIGDAVTDLEAGRITAVMKVFPVAAWFVRRTPGLRMLGQVPDDPQPLGIGFALGSEALVDAVNGALADIRRNGDYTPLARRWGLA